MPPTKTSPLVGLSSAPMTLKRVDLPEPEGPMMERYSPWMMSRLMERRACTTSSPRWKILSTPLMLTKTLSLMLVSCRQYGSGSVAPMRKRMPMQNMVMRPLPQKKPALMTVMYLRQLSPNLRWK